MIETLDAVTTKEITKIAPDIEFRKYNRHQPVGILSLGSVWG
jgi:hypothetical protein